jgi:cytochrome b561
MRRLDSVRQWVINSPKAQPDMAIARGYSLAQIILHWSIAALVSFQLLFGESMTAIVDASESGATASPIDQNLGSAHYWVGLSILALLVIRLAIRFSKGEPVTDTSAPSWMRISARASHFGFYTLLLATPIFGLLAYYVGDPFGPIHSLSKPVFIVLIALHAAAALVHHFWLRDNTLKRMIVPN